MTHRITALQAFVAGALCAACAEDMDASSRAAAAADLDAATSDAMATETQTITAPPFEPGPATQCTAEQRARAVELRMFPAAPPNGPGIAIFHQHNSICNRHPVQVVIHNPSTEALHLEGIGVDDPHFFVTGPALPYTLAPGEIASLQIGFQSEIGEFKPTLSIAAAEGCATFPITARTIDPSESGIVMPRPGVINFGHVAAGTTSDPVEFTLIHQPRRGDTTDKLTASIAAGSPEVRVEPVTGTAALDAAACELRKARVRFAAPRKPGLVRGLLMWETSDAQASALSITDVVGISE